MTNHANLTTAGDLAQNVNRCVPYINLERYTSNQPAQLHSQMLNILPHSISMLQPKCEILSTT